MEIGGLENEARVRGCLQAWQEEEREVTMREAVDLEMGVDVVGREPVGSNADASIADELGWFVSEGEDGGRQ